MALLVARTILMIVLVVFLNTSNVSCALPPTSKNTDSILAAIETADSTEKVILYQKLALISSNDTFTLNQLANYYSDNNDFEQAVHFHFNALHLSLQNGDSNGICLATSGIALNYDLGEQYDSALVYYYMALKLADKRNDLSLKANTLNRLGTIFLTWGNYQEALNYYLKSLQGFETLLDSSGLSKVYNNLGIIYFDFGEYDNALQYYEKSYLIDSLSSNITGQAQLLNNIAITYENFEQVNNAKANYQRSIVLAKQVNDYYQLAITYGNMGQLYLDAGEFSKAKTCYNKTKANYLLANSDIGLAETDIMLGDLYYAEENYEEALKYYFRGLEVVESLGLTNDQLNAYSGIDASYYALGNYDQAYDYSNLYWFLNDSIFNLKASNQLAMLQQGYQIQKKNQEMEVQDILLREQQKRIRRQGFVVALLFVIIIISLIFAFLLFRQHKLRMSAFSQLIIRNKEILQNRAALILAKEKAEESDHLKTSFLMNLSHELRTPMNGIIGFTDLLQNSKVPVNEQKTYLSYISTSSKQLLKVINDIIDIASIETGQLELSKENCNLHDLFSGMFITLQVEAKEMEKGDIGIEYLEPENAGQYHLQTDYRRLSQVLYNLIINALKFTDEGKISFGFEAINNSILKIKVADTGIGIERDKFDLIFERFRQVDDGTSRQHGGSGLGLAICNELVKKMNGRIYLESEIGKGSTFFVELPLEEYKV